MTGKGVATSSSERWERRAARLEAAIGGLAPDGEIPLEELLRRVVDSACALLKARHGALGVLDASGRVGEVVLSVRDQDMGLTAEERAHLFERFYRSPRVRQRMPGTGLGLAICREIVAAHGGRIWAEGAEGEGSAFAFTLPRDEEAA